MTLGERLRPWLLVVLAVGIVLSAIDVFVVGVPQFGRDLVPVVNARDTYVVTSTAGLVVSGPLRTGDRIVFLHPSAITRLQIAAPDAPPETVADQTRRTTLRIADRTGVRIEIIPYRVMRLIVELIAFMLLLLRGGAKGVVPLAIMLYAAQFGYPAFPMIYLGTAAGAVYAAVQPILYGVAAIAAIALACAFAPPTRSVRVAARAGTAIAIANVALFLAIAFVAMTTGYNAALAPHLNDGILAALACAVFCLARGAAVARGSERRRLTILALAIVCGNGFLALSDFGPSIFNDLQSNIALAATALMTVSLVYAVLVEHLFDIALVVNRAVVYGATSSLVILAFIVIEWLVGRLATQLGHVGSATLELGLAVVVGLSLRPIHDRVDGLVDTVVFAARHRAANAILRFADDCAECRTIETLVAGTLDTLRIYARTASTTVLLANDDGDLLRAGGDAEPTVLSADDVAVIRMRTSRAPLERTSFPQLRAAGYAFPMLRRRGLSGAILCTLPARAEPYSPEERDALARLAREVGTAIVSLEAALAQTLLAEVADLRAQLMREVRA